MKKRWLSLILIALLLLPLHTFSPSGISEAAQQFKLGNEVLMEKYHHLIAGKKVGLVTNQSGVNRQGVSTIDVLAKDLTVQLVALYAPEHGIDGVAKAGEHVKSYDHPKLKIPVYSLYGSTRMPTEDMLRNVDVLLFDIQDIGARTYTYISTLHNVMVAAQKYDKPVIILDRPNPVGGIHVEGPVLEDLYKSFVGIDNIPKAHGMTVGEMALFFNRNINATITVIAMEGYNRNMIYQDTGLSWVQTSPNIPDIESVFGYMATGLGEGTGIHMRDTFKWIGSRDLNAQRYANLLNSAGLPGVTFIAEPYYNGLIGGVRLHITDYHQFNPARTGIYALAFAYQIGDFKVPKSSASNIVMFDKVMGTNKIGQFLEQKMSPQEIEARYAPALERFKAERENYLIYGYAPGYQPPMSQRIAVFVNDQEIDFDVDPYIDQNDRLMVPVRFIVEALGAQVQWHGPTQKVTITKGNRNSQFTIGSNIAYVNGTRMVYDTHPVIRHDRTMVPTRYVAESMGATVEWIEETRTVLIELTS
ncbi:exo-beta-N-acetylmuramidase NamZ domain-containing protein [Heliorestis convoluta]|nr:exo-beta-N-acetylmuramidase NamZ domain-containing protein [Heliorestis convoluta]